jgi:RimJ/RimL family protein N-acetyltransferase
VEPGESDCSASTGPAKMQPVKPHELVLKTERLWIRWYRDSDSDRLFDTLSRWEVAQWLGDAPRAMVDREEAVQRIARWRSISETDARHGVWASEVKDSGVVAGCALLVPAPDPDQRYGGAIEIGWHLHPDSWGNGYAREAGIAVMTKGFADGLREVHAFVAPANAPSARVCEAIGMRRDGISRDQWYKGEWLHYRAIRPVR